MQAPLPSVSCSTIPIDGLKLNVCCLEVRFKNNGLDLIEVQDNGSGISPGNYENIGEH
jgi:hypothetical protein